MKIQGKIVHVLISCTNAQNLLVGSEWEHSMNIIVLKLTLEFQWILTDLFFHLLWLCTYHSFLAQKCRAEHIRHGDY